MVGRRSSTGDLTLVGDLGQATGPHRYGDWHEILGHIASKKPANIEELERGYRVPEEILDYASKLLPAIAPGLAPTKGLRPAEGFWVTSTDDAPAAAADDVAETLEDKTGTIGVIAARSMVRAVREELDEAGVEYGTGTEDPDDSGQPPRRGRRKGPRVRPRDSRRARSDRGRGPARARGALRRVDPPHAVAECLARRSASRRPPLSAPTSIGMRVCRACGKPIPGGLCATVSWPSRSPAASI